MPETNGRELQRLVREKAPEIKCLFIPGYTANVITHRGMLDERVHFLQKPFILKNLVFNVQDMLPSILRRMIKSMLSCAFEKDDL